MRPTQATWNGHILSVRGEVAKIVADLVTGRIEIEEWHQRLHDILTGGHGVAYALGRQLAGDLRPLGAGDLLLGRSKADLESTWLWSFVEDLAGQRYRDEDGALKPKPIQARANLYVGKIRAMAGEGFVDASPPEVRFRWLLQAEDNCEDCPEIARLSEGPGGFTKTTLFTYPGDGRSARLSNCACILVRDDGLSTFERYPEVAV